MACLAPIFTPQVCAFDAIVQASVKTIALWSQLQPADSPCVRRAAVSFHGQGLPDPRGRSDLRQVAVRGALLGSAARPPKLPASVSQPHSRTLTSGKLDSTPNARCPASPPRRSGESLPGADCLQSVSGNSRVLDTLDTKLRVEAYYQSGSLPPAVEQLESGARNSQLLHLDVQLEAVPGSSVTIWSITGVCCTSPHSPATPSHSTRPSLADGCS